MDYKSKFFVAALKRTAMNCATLVRRKAKLVEAITKAQNELDSIQVQIDGYQVPIKEATGGFTTEDLVAWENGKWVLKYPETIIPEANCGCGDVNCPSELGEAPNTASEPEISSESMGGIW